MFMEGRVPVRLLSTTLGVGHLVYVPAFIIYPPVVIPGHVSVVAFIAPLWPILFFISGVGLIATNIIQRYVAYAHVACAASFAGLGAAFIYGFLASQTRGNPAFGIACFLLVGVHLALAPRSPQ